MEETRPRSAAVEIIRSHFWFYFFSSRNLPKPSRLSRGSKENRGNLIPDRPQQLKNERKMPPINVCSSLTPRQKQNLKIDVLHKNLILEKHT